MILERNLRARIEHASSYLPSMVIILPGMEFNHIIMHDDVDVDEEGNKDKSSPPDRPIWYIGTLLCVEIPKELIVQDNSRSGSSQVEENEAESRVAEIVHAASYADEIEPEFNKFEKSNLKPD